VDTTGNAFISLINDYYIFNCPRECLQCYTLELFPEYLQGFINI
jgi:hypothetical protein